MYFYSSWLYCRLITHRETGRMTGKWEEEGSTDGWKEKYLDLLDEHEALERRTGEQQNLLTRALLRVSISADGQDRDLDIALGRLRENLRGGELSELQPVLERMDHALLAFDQQREIILQAITGAFNESVKPLQKLPLSRSLGKSINEFVAQVPADVKNFHVYPVLLKTLAAIYEEAVEQLRERDTGLLGKLFGRQPEAPVESKESLAEDSPLTAVALNPEIPAEAQASDEQNRTVVSCSEITEKIQQVLLQLLEEMQLPDDFRERNESIKHLLDTRLADHLLLDSIEQVRGLVADAYLAANNAFAGYLNAVNEELAAIYAVLGGAAEQQQSREAMALEWQESMFRQMSDLEQGTREAADLNHLKTLVNSRLGNIRSALKNFQQSELDQKKLSGQLQELVKRIRAMEADAEKNRSALEKQRYKALHDPLTGLPNREAYNERIANEYHRWLRYRHPLTLAICDLDHFKQINDNFGHQAGDRVLRFISRSIARRLREIDFFGRIGGEEFIFIMPDTTRDQAFVVLEKIRSAIAGTAFNYKNEPMPITLSIGIAQFIEGDRIETALARADAALYSAKSNGRNRCQIL